MTPAQADSPINSWGKSIWAGGVLGGILSLLPIINLLNLLFMAWLVLAGGVTVHLLLKHNQAIKASEALISGALSGLIGGALFSTLSAFALFSLSQEKIEQAITGNRMLSSLMQQETLDLFHSGRFKLTLIIFLCIFTFVSILAGATGGLLFRQFFGHKSFPPHVS